MVKTFHSSERGADWIPGQGTKIQHESESESHSVMPNSLQSHGLCSPWNSPGQDTGVGSLSLLQGIFPTQVLNPGLLHRTWILYQLSHEGRSNMSWGQNNKT